MAISFDFNGLKDRGVIAKQGNISEQYRAVATFLREELNWLYRKITTRCNMSKSSVERICK